jgi:hypothetical protein
MEELESFVGIVGRPPPPVCGSVMVNVGDAEKPSFAQQSDVLTWALLEEGSQGPEVVKVEGFAKIEVDCSGCSVFRGWWVRATEVVCSQSVRSRCYWVVSPAHAYPAAHWQ